MGPISSEARLDAIDAGMRVLQADIEAAFLSDALDHLGEGCLGERYVRCVATCAVDLMTMHVITVFSQCNVCSAL